MDRLTWHCIAVTLYNVWENETINEISPEYFFIDTRGNKM